MSAKAESLYLVDAHSLIYQVFHAIAAMSSPSGLPTNAVFGFARDLFFLRNKKPTRLLCIFDAGPSFRSDLFVEYKAHRSPMPDDLRLQIPMIHDLLDGFRIPKLSQAGFEADDLIATLARAGDAEGMEVFICTTDKDCRQLLSDRVRMFNLRKKEIYDRDSLQKDWGVAPEQVIDFQSLVGDSVDNVPGVPGIGPKTAAQYLQKYGTLDNLLAHLDELPVKKRELFDKVKDKIPMSRELVKLRTDVPMTFDWAGWNLSDIDGSRLAELFRTWGFRSMEDQVRQLLPTTSRRETEPKKFETPPTSIPRPEPKGPPSLFDAIEDDPTEPTPTATVWRHDYRLVADDAAFASFLAELTKQSRFAVDLETTSLEAHAAEIVGIAISWQAGEAHYLAFRGPLGEPTLSAEHLERLRPIFENPAIAKVNQNIKFDLQILKARGFELRGVAGDSMVADYLPNAGERSHGMDDLAVRYLNHKPIPISELLGKTKKTTMADVPTAQITPYACEDADVALRLCDILEPMLEKEGFRRPRGTTDGNYLYDDLEIPLIGVLARMELAGIRLDVPLLTKMSGEMATLLDRLEKEIHELAGRPFNIGSVKQLRTILFDEKGYKSKTRTQITRAASTDQETLEDLARQGHELPRKLLEHRKIAKLKSTYVDALPVLVQPKTGRVHASFNQTVAATGRLSSSDPNLQNIPIRSEMGGQIRQAFLPREGWVLIAADYSQIELRLLAHFSGDETLRQAFAQDQDIHTLVAASIFHVSPEAVTAQQRGVAKTVNFGVIYGMSAFGLADRLEIPKEDAIRFIDTFFAEHPRVLEYQDRLLAKCREDGYVSTILGRRRAISGIRHNTSYKSRNQPEREAINMEIQGSAADLIKAAMLRLDRRLAETSAAMLLQIHDELVFEAPPAEREHVVAIIREEMATALGDRIAVPLGVDVCVGPNWLDAK